MSTPMTSPDASASRALPTPVVVSAATAATWLVLTALVALALYYFIGVDQGATSVFGSNMYIHELVHDGRHFLGFPCH